MKTFNQRFEDKLNSLNCSIYSANPASSSTTGGFAALAGGIPFLLGLGRSNVNPNGYKDLAEALRNGWANPKSPNYGKPGPGAAGGVSINPFQNPFASFTSNGTTPPFTGDSSNSDIAKILAQLGIAIPSLSLPGSDGRPSPFPTPTLPGGPTQPSSSSSTLSTLMQYLIPGLAGLAGGLNNRSGTTSSVPTFDPAVSPLRTQAIQGYTNLLKDPDLTGYQASGESDINHQAGIAKQNTDEILASHGIVSGPAVAGAEANVENNRGNQVTSFKNQIPLLKNSINSNNLAAVNAFLNGQRGTNVTTPGNVAGGAVSGVSSILAALALAGKL